MSKLAAFVVLAVLLAGCGAKSSTERFIERCRDSGGSERLIGQRWDNSAKLACHYPDTFEDAEP